MTVLFDYPAKAAFGKVLPKSKIYEHAQPPKSTRELFVRHIDQIVWQFKLAPETINLPATKAVSEIQIFHLALKPAELKASALEDVLRCIDKAIPFPIVFELYDEDKCKAIACYKRPNEADSTKWVTSAYFSSPWLPQQTARNSLPVSLNLSSLYERLLDPLIPYPAFPQEALGQRLSRIETLRLKENERERLALRLQREKQFNRKVALNAEIRAITQEIEAIMAPTMMHKE